MQCKKLVNKRPYIKIIYYNFIIGDLCTKLTSVELYIYLHIVSLYNQENRSMTYFSIFSNSTHSSNMVYIVQVIDPLFFPFYFPICLFALPSFFFVRLYLCTCTNSYLLYLVHLYVTEKNEIVKPITTTLTDLNYNIWV